MRRIDVSSVQGKAYQIPRDNPFVQQGGFRPEVSDLYSLQMLSLETDVHRE
jgi:hypothetical protein